MLTAVPKRQGDSMSKMWYGNEGVLQALSRVWPAGLLGAAGGDRLFEEKQGLQVARRRNLAR